MELFSSGGVATIIGDVVDAELWLLSDTAFTIFTSTIAKEKVALVFDQTYVTSLKILLASAT